MIFDGLKLTRQMSNILDKVSSFKPCTDLCRAKLILVAIRIGLWPHLGLARCFLRVSFPAPRRRTQTKLTYLGRYRYAAVCNHADGTGPLAAYFHGELMNLPGASASIFDRNKFLAEDRILAFGQPPSRRRCDIAPVKEDTLTHWYLQRSSPRNRRSGDCNMSNRPKRAPTSRRVYPSLSRSVVDGSTGRSPILRAQRALGLMKLNTRDQVDLCGRLCDGLLLADLDERTWFHAQNHAQRHYHLQ